MTPQDDNEYKIHPITDNILYNLTETLMLEKETGLHILTSL